MNCIYCKAQIIVEEHFKNKKVWRTIVYTCNCEGSKLNEEIQKLKLQYKNIMQYKTINIMRLLKGVNNG